MEITVAEKRGWRWQRIMVGVILGSLVFRVFMQAYPTLEPVYQYVVSLSYAMFAGLVLCDTQMLRQPGFALMLLCIGWAVLTSFFHTYAYYEMAQLPPYFYMMLFAFCVCYPLAFVLPEDRGEKAFAAIAAAFAGAVAALSAIAVYGALAGVTIPSLSGIDYTPAGFYGERLTVFAYPTMSAVFCALALLLLVYLFLKNKNAFARVLCVLAGIVAYVAMALTDGRTASIFCCACLGGVGYLVAEKKLRMQKAFLRALVSLCIALAVLAGSYAGLRASVRAVNALSGAIAPKTASVTVTALSAPNGTTVTADAALVAANAGAPEDGDGAGEATDGAKPRSLTENLFTLQGRTYAWEGAIRALLSEPSLLILGSSPVKVMERVDPYIPESPEAYDYFHLHSIYFETLVAFGLPGFLLFAALILYIVFHALRLFFCGRETCTLAERTLPLVLAFCLGVDLLEIFLTFTDVMKVSNPIFFLTAGYVVYLSTTRIPKKRAAKATGAARTA